MKKQFQILAATFISVAIVSCSKQGVQMPETQQAAPEEISTITVPPGRPELDPLSIDLSGMYLFNGNLKDQTKN